MSLLNYKVLWDRAGRFMFDINAPPYCKPVRRVKAAPSAKNKKKGSGKLSKKDDPQNKKGGSKRKKDGKRD